MSHSIELLQVEPSVTAVIRDQVMPGALSGFVTSGCGEVWSFIRRPGLPMPGRNLALYLEDSWVETGVEVSAPFTGTDRIVCSHTPGGLAACAIHYGPYNTLPETHRAIREWCSIHGHRITGNSWELYGHWQEEWNGDSSKIRTDLCYLVEADQKE